MKSSVNAFSLGSSAAQSRNAERLSLALLATGLCGLGVLSIAYRDFALQWQPVPTGLPGRALLALASGLLLIAAGAALVPQATRRWAGIVIGAYLASWALLLHAPLVWTRPADLALWLGLAECAAISIGGFLLGRRDSARPDQPSVDPQFAVRLFGVTLIVFGASHFVYASFTAAMVPAWLPMRLFLAYATGAVHALAGILLLAGRLVRPAAIIEALMMSSFVLLLHLPRVAAKPTDRVELTMLFIAMALTGAAWGIAAGAKDARQDR